MNKHDLLKELPKIVAKYIEDEDIANQLCTEIDDSKIKFVLAEIEKYREKEYSENDHDLIKDLFFYFC